MMFRKSFIVFLILLGQMERYGAAIDHVQSYMGKTVDIFSQTQFHALRDLFYGTGGN